MILEDIKKNILWGISSSYTLVKEGCINELSDAYHLICPRFLTRDYGITAKDRLRRCSKAVLLRHYESVDTLATMIHANQDNISWVDFEPVYSVKDELIIDVKIIPRIGPANCKDPEVQFHAGILLPVRPIEDKSRFDLNERFNKASDIYSILLRLIRRSKRC